MSRHTLAKNYGQLSPRERLQLVLSAEARQDHAAVQRLVDSFPLHAYRMLDGEFTEPRDVVTELNLAIHGRLAAFRSQAAPRLPRTCPQKNGTAGVPA